MTQADLVKVMEKGKWYSVKELSDKLNLNLCSIRHSLKGMIKFGEVEVYNYDRRWLLYRLI